MSSGEGRFRAVAASVQDALIAADESSRIVFWSDSAERIFGWSEREVLGELLTLLMPERLHSAHCEGMSRVVAGGEPRIVGGPPAELVALRRDGTAFPIELTLGRWEEDGHPFFTGVIRDITERRRSEDVLASQYAVAAALAGSHDLQGGVERALEAIGRGMRWQVGHLWLIDREAEVLRCKGSWHEGPDAFSAFAREGVDRSFRRGEGLPGRAWGTHTVVYIDDLNAVENFPRAPAAAAAGLRAGLAVPLRTDAVDHGVVEFFATDPAAHDDKSTRALEALGQQLAQFVMRREAESRLAREKAQQRQAAELNDDVVQGLVIANYELAQGNADSAKQTVESALRAAQRIVSELLGETGPEPGQLRRAAASDRAKSGP